MRPSGPYFSIFESELRVIALEASSRTDETGGDLFGLWSAGGRPVAFLAVGPGPNAVHERAHFGQDVSFLSSVAEVLQDECGLQYLGDWHSHHQLGLYEPSLGDREHVRRITERNAFDSMAELIVTHFAADTLQSLKTDDYSARGVPRSPSGQRGHTPVRIGSFIYSPASAGRPVPCDIVVLPGESPFRQHVARHPILAYHARRPWQSFPMSNVSLAMSSASRSALAAASPERATIQKALAKLIPRLEKKHGSPVEAYEKEFGYVIIIPTGSGTKLGIAIGVTLPYQLLAVYCLGEGCERISDLSSRIPVREAPLGPRLFEWACKQANAVLNT